MIFFLLVLIIEFTKMMVLQEAKLAQEKIPPWELFKKETDKYSQFDDKVGTYIQFVTDVFRNMSDSSYKYVNRRQGEEEPSVDLIEQPNIILKAVSNKPNYCLVLSNIC